MAQNTCVTMNRYNYNILVYFCLFYVSRKPNEKSFCNNFNEYGSFISNVNCSCLLRIEHY